jgi:branched-chain amino acid transport system permease protein
MRGVVIGAIVISLLPELLRDVSEYRYLAFGILLVVVMVFRPQGLWPARGFEPERVNGTKVDPALKRAEKNQAGKKQAQRRGGRR